MKIKKKLYPFLLVFAILLTAIGLVSANISFSVPAKTNKIFNVDIDNINTNNIEVIGYDKTNMTYLIDLSEFISEYEVSFDVYNTSDYDAVLSEKVITDIPDELKSILTVEVTLENDIGSNKYDSAKIKYIVKDNLTKEEKSLLNKYKELKVNVLLNYNQA
ncbi:MAG: hypothetical protein IKP76_00520 [Bacilli bacterium]|nr:hypothetical protein [Bacilli bacterium]